MTQPTKQDDKQDQPVPDKPKDDNGRLAREQAQAYKSVFQPHQLKLDDDTTLLIPPHPNLRLMDDDRLADYDELMFETESYDRGPEIYIPEQTVKDRGGNEIKLPSETRPGPLLEPYRKTVDGVTTLIKPPHSVRVVQAVLGEKDYERLRAGGRSSADVWRIWNQQGLDVAAREEDDSKSDAGAGVLETVPASDSQ